MKSFILIALTTLSVCLGAAVQQSQAPITVGVVQPQDWVLIGGESIASGQPNFVTQMVLQHQLNPVYKVNSVRFMDQDPSQGGFISFVGGLGTNFITYRITSQVGAGFHFKSELWGHDTTEGANLMRSIVQSNCTMTVDDGISVKTSACN